MEADGFNPLNARAASAFSALGDIEGVETIGVVSALGDAEDVADLVAAFRFRRVIVTNMDRTRRLARTLAAVTSGARLAHVTHWRAARRRAGNPGARRAGDATAGKQRALLALAFAAAFAAIVDRERPRAHAHHQQQTAADREVADEDIELRRAQHAASAMCQ